MWRYTAQVHSPDIQIVQTIWHLPHLKSEFVVDRSVVVLSTLYPTHGEGVGAFIDGNICRFHNIADRECEVICADADFRLFFRFRNEQNYIYLYLLQLGDSRAFVGGS